MPSVVVKRETTMQGKIISVGLVLDIAVRMPISVVGISCNPQQFITNSIAIPFDIFPVPLSIFSIAFIAGGVDALPIPSRFADILSEMSLQISSSVSPNNFFSKGFVFF